MAPLGVRPWPEPGGGRCRMAPDIMGVELNGGFWASSSPGSTQSAKAALDKEELPGVAGAPRRRLAGVVGWDWPASEVEPRDDMVNGCLEVRKCKDKTVGNSGR
jgi:hypothetical protein